MDSDDSDQTGQMPRLRWAHSHIIGFVMLPLSITCLGYFGTQDIVYFIRILGYLRGLKGYLGMLAYGYEKLFWDIENINFGTWGSLPYPYPSLKSKPH